MRRRMQRLFVAGAALAFVLTGTVGSAAASTEGVALYVTNTNGTLVHIDPAGPTVGPEIPVGQVPIDVAITADGETAYVVRGLDVNAVVPVDLDTATAGADIPVQCPTRIALVPGQPKAYVTQVCGSKTVVPIDLSTKTVGTPIDVGVDPYDIAVSADGETAWVTARRPPDGLADDSQLIAVDVATDSVRSRIPLGTDALLGSVALTADGTKAFVAVETDDVVLPVDLATGSVGSPIAVSPRPADLALTRDESILYVTHYPLGPTGLSDPEPEGVTPIDVSTQTAAPQIPVGHWTFGVVFTDDGTTAFVSHVGDAFTSDDSAIAQIDVATGSFTQIPFPGDPLALAIRPSFSDTTPPTVELETTPATPTGGAGAWFNGADLGSRTLVVSANASDEGSGVASLTCVVNGETRSVNGSRLVIQGLGEGVHTVSCTGEDVAGNVSDPPVSATYRVDTVAPTLQPTVSGSGPGGTALLQDPAAAADAGAEDSGSGVKIEACGALDVSSVGVHEVSCSATDVAGNTRTAEVSYVVRYALVGLSPEEGTTARAGRPLQIRISLADADGSLQAPCEGCTVLFQAFAVGGSGQNAGPFEMRYHAASQQLRTSWKPSASGTGPTRITVTVQYPGTTLTTTRSAQITLT